MQSKKINGNWQRLQSKNQSQSLIWRLRKNHIVINFKHYMLFYGGEPLTPPSMARNSLIQLQPEQNEMNPQVNFHSNIHKLDLVAKNWSEHNINLSNVGSTTGILGSTLDNISEHSSCILNNFIYFYGGLNYATKMVRPPQLWIINAQSLIFKKVQTKGTPPSARCKPTLIIFNKNNILLYGGYYEGQYYNDIYIYKMEFKTWVKVQDTQKYCIPKILNSCLVGLGDSNLYLYGGHRQIALDSQIQKIPNYDLYKIKVIMKTVTLKPDTDIRKVISNLPEIQASGSQMLNYTDKYFLLLNHDHNINRLKSTWFFNPRNLLWTQVTQSSLQHQNHIKSSAIFVTSGDKIYACNQNIYYLALDQSFLAKDMEETEKQVTAKNCSICLNEANSYRIPKRILKSQFKSYLQPIDFVYSAIGLLADNCILANSQICNLYFTTNTSTVSTSQKAVIIEDDGQPSQIWGDQENSFTQVISCFYSGCMDSLLSEADYRQHHEQSLKQITKKHKLKQKQLANLQKHLKKQSMNPNYNFGIGSNTNNPKNEKDYEKDMQQLMDKKKYLQYKHKLLDIKRKQLLYGANWKIGGLRIGDLLILASRDKGKDDGIDIKQIKRFALIQLETEKGQKNSKGEYYACYSYILQNGLVINPQMEADMKYVTKNYKKQMKTILQKLKSMKNVVYISGLRKQIHEEQNTQTSPSTQLHFRKKYNDIYLGSSQLLASLDGKPNLNISQLCDISLKTYISLLYTQKDLMRINISVRDVPLEQIPSQKFLNIIDKLKTKKIVSVDDCLDFQCKIIEVYYVPPNNDEGYNAKCQNTFTNNGVLFYSKARLISRFGINLGQLLDIEESQLKSKCINKDKLFGVIQVNQNFAANVFKTDFLYPTALEPFYSRLNFVLQYYRKNYNIQKTKGKQRRNQLGSTHKIKKKQKNQ